MRKRQKGKEKKELLRKENPILANRENELK